MCQYFNKILKEHSIESRKENQALHLMTPHLKSVYTGKRNVGNTPGSIPTCSPIIPSFLQPTFMSPFTLLSIKEYKPIK